MQLTKIVREAIMGAGNYSPPEAGLKLMADFYTINILKHSTQHTESHHNAMLQAELDNAENILLPYLQAHLASCAGYSVICEMRHCIDSAIPTKQALQLINAKSSDPKMIRSANLMLKSNYINATNKSNADFEKSIKAYGKYMDRNTYPRVMLSLEIMRLISPAQKVANFYYRGDDWHNWWANTTTLAANQAKSWLSMARPSRSTVLNIFSISDIAQCCQAGIILFEDNKLLDWQAGFGGTGWVQASRAIVALINAKGANIITELADHIFDLEHNTGNLLDKNEEYTGAWLSRFLDIKRDAVDPEDIALYASPYIRKLCQYAMREQFGRSWKYGKLSSNRLDNKFPTIVANEFNAYAKLKGFGVVSINIETHIYDHKIESNNPDAHLDKMGTVKFIKDCAQIRYKPFCPNRSNTHTRSQYTASLTENMNYDDYDFEDPKTFDIILDLLKKYPTGRKIETNRALLYNTTEPKPESPFGTTGKPRYFNSDWNY